MCAFSGDGGGGYVGCGGGHHPPSWQSNNSTETSPQILTPSSSQSSISQCQGPNTNSAPGAVPMNFHNPHTEQRCNVFPHTSHPACYPGQYQQPGLYLQGPPHQNEACFPFNPMTQQVYPPQAPLGMGEPGIENRRPNGGGPVNYQPWRSGPEYGAEPRVDAYGNVASESRRNQQVFGNLGPRLWDFRDEAERIRYYEGWGLPAEGDSPEVRLFRAINMNHYLLIDQLSRSQEGMKEYICETVKKAVEISHNSLGLQIQHLQDKIGKLSTGHVGVEPPLNSPPRDPQRAQQPRRDHIVPDTENNHSLEHLEIAILKLWHHIDKIGDEQKLRQEERAERKQIEEIIADEVLYHRLTMEKMQTKLHFMAKEVTGAWKEIDELKDVVKVLQKHCFGKTPDVKPMPPRPNVMMDELPIPAAPTSTDPAEMLLKIDQELDHLDGKHKGKGSQGDGDDDCYCDLCGKSKEGKSAGVGLQREDDGGSSQEDDGFVTDDEDEIEVQESKGNEIKQCESREEPGRLNRKLTAGDRLEELNLTAHSYLVLTNVTLDSDIVQRWRKAGRTLRSPGQIVELLKPNGDVIMIIAEPKRPGSGPGGDKRSPLDSMEIICPPGPYPRTLEEAFEAFEAMKREHRSSRDTLVGRSDLSQQTNVGKRKGGIQITEINEEGFYPNPVPPGGLVDKCAAGLEEKSYGEREYAIPVMRAGGDLKSEGMKQQQQQEKFHEMLERLLGELQPNNDETRQQRGKLVGNIVSEPREKRDKRKEDGEGKEKRREKVSHLATTGNTHRELREGVKYQSDEVVLSGAEKSGKGKGKMEGGWNDGLVGRSRSGRKAYVVDADEEQA